MGKTSKPLPCPFCGTGAVIMRLISTRMVGNKSQHPYLIGCSDPECILYDDTHFNNLGYDIIATILAKEAENYAV